MTKRLISFLIALCLLIAIPLSARYKYNPFTRKLDYYEPVSGSDLGDLGDVTFTALGTGAIIYRNASTTWVNLAAGVNGTYLSLAAGIPAWTAIPAPSFLALTDSPAAYTGKAGQLVRVNAVPDGLEFFAGSAAGTVIVADGSGGWTKDENFLIVSGGASVTGEIDITKATTLLIDLNPGFQGSGVVIEMTPSAVINTVDAEWDAINILGAALDPSVAGVEIHGIHVDFSGVDMAQSPYVDALRLTLPTDMTMDRAHSIRTNRGFYIEQILADCVPGMQSAGIDFVYDTTGATGGMVHAMDVAEAGTGTVTVAAIGTHTGIDVIHQHIGTITAFDQVWEYDNDGPGWTDITAACANPAVDVQIWDDGDDEVYFGQAVVFDEIPAVWNTVATKDMFLDFYYSIGGSGWTQFYPSDDTIGAQVTGSFRFLASDLAGWATDTVNGTANKYWIRIERTRVAGVGPTEDTIQYVAGVSYTWAANGEISIKDITVTTPVNVYGLSHNSFADWAANKHVVLPNTLANVLSDHDLAAHTGLGLSTVTVFTALTDTPGAYAGQGLELVRVNVGTTAVEFLAYRDAAGNQWLGDNALDSLTNGERNVAYGYNALTAVAGAWESVAIGYEAGASIVASDGSVFIGSEAGKNSTIYGTAIGYLAGMTQTSGENNTYVGYEAGKLNATSHYNTAVGESALEKNTAASNTAVGFQAGVNNTAGTENIYVGDGGGYFNQTGSYNVIVGSYAGYGVTLNSYSGHTLVGYHSGYSLTTATENAFFGYRSGHDITTGSRNTFIGYEAGDGKVSVTDNTGVGYQALYGTGPVGNFNTAVGAQSLYQTIGFRQTVVGYQAGYSNVAGNDSVYLGFQAGFFNVAGNFNVVVGSSAGYGVSTNSYSNNVIVGYQAAEDITTGTHNVVIGYMAGEGWLDTESEKLVIDVTDTTTPLIYGDFLTDNITINGDFNVTMDAALDQIVFAQSAVAGTEDQPLIFINDDRIGATATELSEATISIDSEGVYALAIMDGILHVEDGLHLGGTGVIDPIAATLLVQTSTPGATYVAIKGNGGALPGFLTIYDEDEAENLSLTCNAGKARIKTFGAAPGPIWFQSNNPQDIVFWTSSLASGNPYFYMYGHDGANPRYLRMRVDSNGDAIIEPQYDLSIKKGDGVYSLTVNFDDADPTALCTVADGYVITDCWIEVTTAWDGNGYIEVGDGGDDDGFMNNTNYDDSTPGYYGNDIADRGDYLVNGLQHIYTGADTIDIKVTTGSSTQGIATVYVHITRLK